MTTAFSTPTRAVVIKKVNGHQLQASDPDTGALLGTAIRARGKDCEWFGWLVQVDGRVPVDVPTITAAGETLARLASTVDGAR